MGSSKPGVQMIPSQQQGNQTQTVQLPQWVSDAGQSNYQSMVDATNRGYQSYGGERVAGLSALEQQAPQTLQAGMDRANQSYGTAMQGAQSAMGYNPERVAAQNVQAQGFLDRDVNAYMDPYNNAVVNTTLGGMRDELARQGNASSDAARGSGSWGGSRFAVEDAVRGVQGARGMAATEAGLRSNAFNSAAGLIQQDNASALQAALANQGANLQAGLANQSSGLQGANLRLAGSGLANTIGNSYMNTGLQGSMAQAGFGQTARGIDQARLDAQYQDWANQQNYPIEAANQRAALLGMTPYGKTMTGTSSQQGLQGQSIGSTNPWLTGLGTAAAVAGVLSDRKAKKNVENVGKVPGTDLNAYKFQYKKGFMGHDTAPKVGLMADDVKKKVPGAVTPLMLGGKKVDTVDYQKAITGARKGRTDRGAPRGKYRPRMVA